MVSSANVSDMMWRQNGSRQFGHSLSVLNTMLTMCTRSRLMPITGAVKPLAGAERVPVPGLFPLVQARLRPSDGRWLDPGAAPSTGIKVITERTHHERRLTLGNRRAGTRRICPTVRLAGGLRAGRARR
jgi:hypothetical protein